MAVTGLKRPLVFLFLSVAVAAAGQPDEWTRKDAEAAAQYRRGEYDDALISARQALTVAERGDLGAARVASSLNALALIHQAQGRYSDAQPLLERAIEISVRALPADHPNIATLRANLASLQEARRRHELALDARRAQELNEQAMAHHGRGEYELAAALYEQVLPIVETHFGAGSVEAARVVANWADTCEQRKDHSRAEVLYRRALDVYEARADEAVARATVLNALASVHYMQRQYGKAEPLFKRSLQVLETVRGAEHVDLLPVLDNLVALNLATRRADHAGEFQRRAAAIRKASGLE